MAPKIAQIARLKNERAALVARLGQIDESLQAAFVDAHSAGLPVDLLAWIEAHLRATGTAASTFGMEALGDPGFVRNLRAGRTLRPATDILVRRYLAATVRTAPEISAGCV